MNDREEYLRKWKARRTQLADQTYLNYIEVMSNFIYMSMDAKITNDILTRPRLPEIIVSPFATNNTTEKQHKAIYIRKSELDRLATRDTYEDAYYAIIQTPFRCSFIQEAYFAMFASVYIMQRMKIIHVGGVDVTENEIQSKLLSISISARKSIMNALDILWKEVINSTAIYACLDTHRERTEALLIKIVNNWIFEPFYGNGTFAFDNDDVGFVLSRIDPSIFNVITYIK
jgi:hypothetical protein